MSSTYAPPRPQLENWDWQHQGACRNLDTEMFFHPEGERGLARQRRSAAAKRICQTCPVADQCLEHALSSREPYGIWGGMTEEERRSQATLAAAS